MAPTTPNQACCCPTPGAAAVQKPAADDSRELTLTLAGLHCASCARTAEHALSALPAVESASVNFATQQAQVRVRAGEAPVEAVESMKQAIARAGYEVIGAAGPALRPAATPLDDRLRCRSQAWTAPAARSTTNAH